MTKLGFQLGGGLGSPEPILADSEERKTTGAVGTFGIGLAPIGGFSYSFYDIKFIHSDSINFLQDQVNFPSTGLKEVILSDSFTLFDDFLRLRVQYIAGSKGDQADYYLPSFKDSINNLSDSFRSAFVKLVVSLSDSVNNLSESATIINCIVEYLTSADALNLTDSATWEYAEKYQTFSDSLNLFDSLFIQGFGEDNTLNLTDSISIYFLDDAVSIIHNYFSSFSDQLQQISEAFSSGDPTAIQAYDTFQYFWQDSVETSFLMVLQVADFLDLMTDLVQTLIESPVLPLSVRDDLNNLLDQLTGIQYNINLLTDPLNSNDIIVITDSIKTQMDHLMSQQEALQQFFDLLVLFSGNTNFSDGLQNFTEQVNVTLSGVLGFSDSLNNLSDSFTYQIGPQALNLTPVDSFILTDGAAAVNLGNPLLTLVAAESLNNLADGFNPNTGIVPGTVDVSRIRRYLGDLIN